MLSVHVEDIMLWYDQCFIEKTMIQNFLRLKEILEPNSCCKYRWGIYEDELEIETGATFSH
jgi:hypothetical protein